MLLDWLEQQTLPAILSVDMLVYGGLVASRALDLPAADACARADRLDVILRKYPREVQAFSVVMRVPPYCTSDDDRRFSDRLLAYSQAAASTRGGPLAKLRLQSLRKKIPAQFLRRYLDARARNSETNRRFLGWARDGLLHYGILGMDDSKTEGFNVTERRALEPLVPSNAALIPGADELALLLLARTVLEKSPRKPRVEVRYSPETLARRVTRYEDRAVQPLVEAHLAVLGLTATRDAPDVVLFVHGPSGAQQEASTQILPPRASRRVRALAREVAACEPLAAVADLAYANGGDRALVAALAEEMPLARLAGYAAWNTAGNTVGTVLAQALIRWASLRDDALDPRASTETHVRFLFERFVDDWAYQSEVRQEVGARLALQRRNIYALGEAHSEVAGEVDRRLREAAGRFFEKGFRGGVTPGPRGTAWRVDDLRRLDAALPWPRIFEVQVRTEFGLQRA